MDVIIRVVHGLTKAGLGMAGLVLSIAKLTLNESAKYMKFHSKLLNSKLSLSIRDRLGHEKEQNEI